MFNLRWFIITRLQIIGFEKSEQVTMTWENIVWENDVHHVPDHTDHRGGRKHEGHGCFHRILGVRHIIKEVTEMWKMEKREL